MLLFIGDIREVRTLLPENHNYKETENEESVLFYELKKVSVTNPETLIQSNYLNTFAKRLENLDTSLLIRKNVHLIYTSSEKVELEGEDLPGFGSAEFRNDIQKLAGHTYSVKQHDFYLPDGEEVSVFLVRDASPLLKFTHTFFPVLFVILILVLVLTNGLLTYFVSKSIIKPIEQLKRAANQIKGGNLDHSLTIIKQDEIGQLAQSFEEMRKQLKESFEIQNQYEENRKELLAHISHDLKTPITAIKGYVEGIRDGVADTREKQDRYIQTIYAKAVDLDQLIDELFLYSKLDLKKLPFHFENINLRSYLSDYIEELQFDLEKKDTTLTFAYEEGTTYFVSADPEKLKRVLSNIIENSLKYMDKAVKNIHISLLYEDDFLKVSIADNGPGISLDALPFIFERFYRAEQSRNVQTGGSGLGLAIARMIILEHNGTIFAESEINKGTTISFKLKLKDEE